MTSVIVPPVDLAPGMPSRVVTISATDITEGGKSLAGQKVWFALSDSLDVTSGGDVIAKTSAEVVLDANGNGQIRLPVYSADVKTWCGKEWAVIVSTSWGSQKAVRVPAGSTTIALSALPNVRPLRGRELQWSVTGAAVTIVEGAQWDASIVLFGGILTLTLTVPPGATAYWRGSVFSADGNVDTLTEPGAYFVWANTAGLPAEEPGGGVVEVSETRSTGGVVSQVQQELRTVGTTPKTYRRFQGSSGWSEWVWAGGSDSLRTSTVLPTDDLDLAVRPGAYAFWGTAANTPSGGSGTAITTELLSNQGTVSTLMQLAYVPGISTTEIWTRYRGTTGWAPWVRADAGAVAAAPVGLRPASPASKKLAPLSMSTGFGGSQRTGSGTTVIAQWLPPSVGRLQVHLVNRNPRYQLLDAPTVTVTNVAIGLHDGNGGSTSWTSLSGTGTTPWDSTWVEVPPAWRGKDIAVRYTWSGSGTIQNNIGTAWTGGVRDGNPPLWAWLECEVPADTPVVAAFGDSLSSGVGASRPVMDAWIVQWAKTAGAFPAFWAHSGDASTTWAEDTPRKWFAYGMNVAAPDALIYAMGSNEVYGGSAPSLTVMQQRVRDTVGMIRTKLTPNVFGATIMPRTSDTSETLRRQVNAWYPQSGLFRQVFDFVTPISSDDETIIPAYDADGTHLTTGGYGQIAAAVPSTIVPASWSAAIAALHAAAS